MKIETGLQEKKKFIEATAPVPPKIPGPLNPTTCNFQSLLWGDYGLFLETTHFSKSEGKLSFRHIILVCVLLPEFLQPTSISAWVYYWSSLENKTRLVEMTSYNNAKDDF